METIKIQHLFGRFSIFFLVLIVVVFAEEYSINRLCLNINGFPFIFCEKRPEQAMDGFMNNNEQKIQYQYHQQHGTGYGTMAIFPDKNCQKHQQDR